MSPTATATLDEIGEALVSGGFEMVEHKFRSVNSGLLAQSPYATVGCFEIAEWPDLHRLVGDFQAELTQVAAAVASNRLWDLYVVVHVLTRPPGPREEALVETIEADTRYARKFVRTAIPASDAEALERALLPLLPLRGSRGFEVVDPMTLLRDELTQLNVPAAVADAAIDAFSSTSEVLVP